jgi:hypothetical protein
MASDAPTLGRNWGEINVPSVITGRMNVPNGQGLPEGPPDQGQRPR